MNEAGLEPDNREGPVFPDRAVLLDVSRGRVPRLSALFDFVELISGLGYNQLTFNIEHTFACPKHPKIGQGHDPLTQDEMKELDAFSKERKVEIIPFQQSLGHLLGIVSLPEYRHLAYDRELNWSLDPSKEDTYKLLADLYDAQIEVTSSSLFHVGCDEPFDIIKKFDPDRFGGRAPGSVIRDHLIRLHGMLKERGKTMMAWADAVLAHPEVLPDLPDDLILCHWSYGSGALEGPDHYRPGLEKIAEAGLPFYACTCSWSLMKIFPDLAVMKANHDGFLPEAKRLGAQGMMITIWGDMGHMNLAGLESCPLAYGAQRKMEKDAFLDLAREMDRVNRIIQGPAGMGGVGFLLLFSEPLDTAFSDAAVKDYRRAAKDIMKSVDRARVLLMELEESDAPLRSLWLDHYLPVAQMELLAVKLSLVADLKKNWPDNACPKSAKKMESFASQCREAAQRVSACLMLLESRWLISSKESDLEINRIRHRRLIRAWISRAEEFESYAEKSRAGEAPPALETILKESPSGYAFNVLEEMGLLGLL
jgi:hypothetical protein